ncbi:MAG: HlyD family efflux transporter periplasmic adaptor subunit [Acidobacteriota bacterium]|nr:HlyD family efflux transporter periplasmic adaptor subunit [Acidobacteriota bacterium]
MKAIRWAARMIPVVIVVLFTTAALLIWIGRVEKVVEAPGVVEVQDFEKVRAEVPGIVARVAARPGETVEAGQLLLVLENGRLQIELETASKDLQAARLSLEEAQRRRRLLVEESHPRELELARSEIRRLELLQERRQARVGELEVSLNSAAGALGRAEELLAAGLISDSERDEASSRVEEARWRLRQSQIEGREDALSLEAARGRRQLIESQHRRVMVELDALVERLSQEVEQLKSRRIELASQVAALEIHADTSGVLAGPEPNELLRRSLGSGEEVLTILDDTSVQFVASVPEEAIVKIRRGQPVTVEVSGLPKRQFEAFDGTVEEVDLQAQTTASASSSYRVRIRLERPWVVWEERNFYLRDGMQGRAKISYRSEVRLLRSLVDWLVGNPS